jgi:hypothetical protein
MMDTVDLGGVYKYGYGCFLKCFSLRNISK